MRKVTGYRRTLTMLTVVAFVPSCGDGTGPSGPPMVLSVNGATLPTGPVGSTVIVEGQNFGAEQHSGAVVFTTATGTVAATIAGADDWTDGFIVTTVPSGAVTGPLVVETSEGTSVPVTFTVTQGAVFSPSTVSWTATSDLPVALSGLAAVATSLGSAPMVYAIGGADDGDTPQTSVYSTTVGATGSLAAWNQTVSLTQAVAFHRAVVATPANAPVTGSGYILVLGGVTDDAGTVTDAIQRGALGADGSVVSWTAGGTLPQPLRSFGAAIVFGQLYVWGGAGSGNVPAAAAYRAPIGPGGVLGAWEALTALPFGRAQFGYGAFAGRLYALGGDSSATAPGAGALNGGARISTVTYAKIDLHSRDLTAAGWTDNPATLIKATSKHTTLVAGGNVLATAGLYNGAATGATEESYAQLNADGTLGSFNGATGSNTILSQGGGNLYNHTVVGYVDADGAYHVLVLGGDDVNAPGTKHAEVFYY